jgi:hypothetical protein
VIRNQTDDTRDQLAFRWSRGPELEVSAFGNPGTDTPVNVCVYLNANPVGSASVPSGVGWTETASSVRFRDRAGTNDGLRSVKLKAGSVGNPRAASVVVAGRGAGLPLPDLPVLAPFTLTVQVRTLAGCWGTDFSEADLRRMEPDRLSLRQDP